MRYALPFLLSASGVYAQDTQFSCQGTDPAWTLTTTQDGATFDYVRTSDLTLALTTTAQNADWPRAYTFIGRGDSAILLLESAQDSTHIARVLTQRGETPILLVGSCVRR